ncbi:50S ribosome-binding GTPase (macronuclear) [Tetrahymena thermophila SB210]|uniref:50S ribosome-binding GTPase n=1 Tax=Tetrahymena thermophila (strain SB210) TaxID=312017 RepID=W7XH38_TETTS|nr:50S ribosome-binding GTPase [Tetrahymena thermophila SB210]EWS73636.1 50S ribosome-binding GTPase [Tetrahymena thermophila SB210]|eukprot:XP_012653866.1 50S ribosome-binding GTPase [Tetrahymena thermophila SB210]
MRREFNQQISLEQQDYKQLNILKNGNESEVIISDMISSFSNSVKQQVSNKKNVVFIIGNTGSGKTTLAAFLSGIDLIVEKNKFNQRIINYESKYLEFKNKVGENVLESETSFPNVFESSSCVYIDCPGFQDTKLTKADIINSFFIHYFQQNAMQVKIILLIDGSLLDCKGLSNQRCQPYKQQIQYLISMTKDTCFDISRNLLIVISKTTQDNITFYQDKLRKVFKALSVTYSFIQELDETKYFNISYQQFFRSLLQTKIITFPSPPEDYQNYQIYITARQTIEQSLNNMTYYYDNDLKVPLSINCYQYLLKLESEIQIVIKNKLKNALNILRNQIQQNESLIYKYIMLMTQIVSGLDYPFYSTDKQQLLSLLNFELIAPIENEFSIFQKKDIEKELSYIEFLSKFAYNLFFNKISYELQFDTVFKKVVLIVLKEEIAESNKQQEVLLNQMMFNNTQQCLEKSNQELRQKQQQLNEYLEDEINYDELIQIIKNENQVKRNNLNNKY